MNSTVEKSYLKHINAEKNIRIKNTLPSRYKIPNSIDAWRHNRMRNTISPIIRAFPKSKWMTLGDGLFGTDANYLQNHKIDVTATSISDETLIASKQLGYIHKFKKVNAENISEQNNSFDFLFCKEAYHHFPRPPIALYEMLRVAKKGVILIEPQENKDRLFNFLKKIIKKYIRNDTSFYFEKGTDNYIYKVNINELSKMMIALNHKYIVFKRFNDFHLPNLAEKNNKRISFPRLFFQMGIGVQNILCKLRLLEYGLVTAILFKEEPDKLLLKSLKKDGFCIKRLPVNPFI